MWRGNGICNLSDGNRYRNTAGVWRSRGRRGVWALVGGVNGGIVWGDHNEVAFDSWPERGADWSREWRVGGRGKGALFGSGDWAWRCGAGKLEGRGVARDLDDFGAEEVEGIQEVRFLTPLAVVC